MKNKKIVTVIIALLIILVLGILFFVLLQDNSQYINYSQFKEYVENKKVETVDLYENKIYFKLQNDINDYYTDNPETDNFKEFLLLNDVEVTKQTDFLIIFDILFYLFFFGIVGFGVYKLIKFKISTFKVIRKNDTRFADIAGLDELKQDMLQAVEILKNPKKYEEKGVRAPNGIMLEGNPGNGKTLFARALAGEANINFIPTKATDFQSAMMSVGPAKIKALFKKARKNKPCIVFIDEFDGIGERRNYSGSGIDKENNRIITAMLNEMDGFEHEEGVMIIGATNSYNSLDPALIRAGRFDKKYVVSNPDLKTRVQLIDIYTSKKQISETIPKEKLAENFNGLTCSQIEAILNEAATIAIIKKHDKIDEEDILEAIRKITTIKIAKLKLK